MKMYPKNKKDLGNLLKYLSVIHEIMVCLCFRISCFKRLPVVFGEVCSNEAFQYSKIS